MNKIGIDTSFILSLVTARQHSAAARAFLQKMIRDYHVIRLPAQVIAEFVYVLEGIHKYSQPAQKLSRHEIVSYVKAVLNTPRFQCEKEDEVDTALGFYEERSVPFGDALIAADLIHAGIPLIATFDADYRKIPGLQVLTSAKD